MDLETGDSSKGDTFSFPTFEEAQQVETDKDDDHDDKAQKTATTFQPSSTTRQPPLKTRISSWWADIRFFDTRTKKAAWGLFALVVVITGVILLATSLKKVQTTEYGLQYNVHKKQLADAAKSGGLFTGPPGFEFIKFPSTFVSVELPQDICVSKDGLRVAFQVSFQYQIQQDWVLPVVTKYRDFDKWATVVEGAGTSAVQHTCSEFVISSFQNQRGVIQATMEENLRLKLEGPEKDGVSGVYARAISLQLRNLNLPEEYKLAVREKQAAAEDIQLAKNQRVQELTKATTNLLAAKEQARRVLDTAVNDANVTLTEAQLKAEEITFAFETEAAVLVRVKNSLNLTTEGVLAYMSNHLYQSAPHLTVSATEPAKLSRADEL